MSDKKLIIGSQFDDKGVKQAERVLKGLRKEGLETTKVFKGFDVATNHGLAKFAKSVVFAEKNMGKLKGTTADTAKVMENVYGRQLEKESKRLDTVTKQLDRLNKMRKESQERYKREVEINPNGRIAQHYGNRTARLEGMITSKELERRATQNGVAQLQPGGISMQNALLGATIAESVARALHGVGNTINDMKTMPWNNAATTSQFRSNIMRSIMSGDLSQLDVMVNGRAHPLFSDSKAMYQSGIDILNGASGKTGANLSSFGSAAGDVASATKDALTFKAGASGEGADGITVTDNAIARAGGIGGKLARAGATTTNASLMGGNLGIEAQNMMTVLNDASNLDPSRKLAMEYLQQTSGMRLAASRRYGDTTGGDTLSATMLGSTYGLGTADSLTHAVGLADRFGGGLTKSGLFKNSLDMETQGFNRNTAGGMLGNLSMMNGGDTQRAKKELEDIFTRGIDQGMKKDNIQFFEAIGQAAADGLMRGGSKTSGIGRLGSALTYGMDGDTSMMDVQNRIGAVNGLDNMFKTNGYFQAARFSSGLKHLGKGMSGGALDAVGGASFARLFADSDKELDAWHIPLPERKNIGFDSFKSMFGSVLDKKSDLGKQLYNKNGDVTSNLKSLIARAQKGDKGAAESVTQLGSLLGNRYSQYFNGAEGGEQALYASMGYTLPNSSTSGKQGLPQVADQAALELEKLKTSTTAVVAAFADAQINVAQLAKAGKDIMNALVNQKPGGIDDAIKTLETLINKLGGAKTAPGAEPKTNEEAQEGVYKAGATGG